MFGREKRDAELAGLLAEATDQLDRKERTAAQATVERALMLDAGNVPALQLRGAILCELGQVDAGLASFRAALSRDRRNGSLRFDCGNALCLAGDKGGAEIEYRLAIQASPDFMPAHKALGGLLIEAKRPAEAAAVLEEALTRAPHDIELKRRLALACYHAFDYGRACALYRPLYEGGALDLGERYAYGAAALNQPDQRHRRGR
jgi:Tfp pilus assembly protein PilF